MELKSALLVSIIVGATLAAFLLFPRAGIEREVAPSRFVSNMLKNDELVIIMNLTGANNTGVVIICGSEIARLGGALNKTVLNFAYKDANCTLPDLSIMGVGECEKATQNKIRVIVQTGEEKVAFYEEHALMQGNEEELTRCEIKQTIVQEINKIANSQ